jgi:outer membrane biogenesis lipoprotein LolB
MTRALAAVVLLASACALSARVQMANCAWYEDTSLEQQQQNDLRKCGLRVLE